MIRLSWGCLFLLPAVLLGADTYSDLPYWARPAYLASRKVPKPQDADDWILLDRTEFAYTGDGEIAIHHYQLIEVLTTRGIQAGVFTLSGLGGKASTIKRLKGWNLRPDGDLVKLDSDQVVVVDKDGDSTEISNERRTSAILSRVVQGSLLVFESIQVEKDPIGPAAIVDIMRNAPIFRWELEAATHGGWFRSLKQVSHHMDLVRFSPWIPSPSVVPNTSITADNVPAIPTKESATPYEWEVLPRVGLVFVDPDLKDTPDLASWDGLASWMEAVFTGKAAPSGIPGQPAGRTPTTLGAILQWIDTHLTYKMIYLSPERGWVPSQAAEVVRRGYGDCKDLACCFIAAARAAGFEAYPVLARIPNQRISPEEPFNPGCFDHVLAAVALPQTLHLDSEVVTPKGRFLLVDATARFTPLGKLPDVHAGGRVMICCQGKGIWADIPDSAVESPRLEARLTGAGSPTGAFQGELRFQEWANARSLRSAALGMSPADFQRHLFSDVLALPANARIQVLRHSDPLDLSRPFELDLRLDDPRGFDIHGSEWDLQPMGVFRMVPGMIQKAGQPRRFPIQTFSRERDTVEADLTVPVRLMPLLARRSGSTPFHAFRWEAEANPTAEGGCRLSLRYQDQDTPASFGFPARDTGLEAWARDRRMMQEVIDDALAFEVKASNQP